MVAAGMTPEQVSLVMEMFDEREEERKAGQRARTARYWSRMDVTRGEWEELRWFVFSRDGMICCYCGDHNGPFEIDHIFPVSRGGASVPDNLCVACAPCNAGKRDRTPEEWAR